MKKTYVTTVGTFLLGLTLNSCIQEEAPNAEADITACSLLPVDCLASNTIEVGLPYSDQLNADHVSQQQCFSLVGSAL